jgi:hypothetical protein
MGDATLGLSIALSIAFLTAIIIQLVPDAEKEGTTWHQVSGGMLALAVAIGILSVLVATVT